MPLALIARDPEKVSNETMRTIINILPFSIAQHLSVPGFEEACLTENDVEVRCSNFSPLDIKSRDIEITILANYYPQRNINLNEDAVSIVEDLYKHANTKSISVWIFLGYGGFFESPKIII